MRSRPQWRFLVPAALALVLGGAYFTQTAFGGESNDAPPADTAASLSCLQDGPVLSLIAEISPKKTDVLAATPLDALTRILLQMESPLSAEQFVVTFRESDLAQFTFQDGGRTQMVATSSKVGDGWAVTTLSACPNATANGAANSGEGQ